MEDERPVITARRNYFFLVIEEGQLVVQYDNEGWHDVTVILHSVEEYTEFFAKQLEAMNRGGADLASDDLVIMASSALDFPEDYTDDEAVIELCNQIRF